MRNDNPQIVLSEFCLYCNKVVPTKTEDRCDCVLLKCKNCDNLLEILYKDP